MDVLFENIDKGYIKNIGCTNWSLERMKLANEYAQKCKKAGFVVSSDRWSLAKFKPDKDPSIVPFKNDRYEYMKKNNLTEIPFQSMGRGTISLIAEGKEPEDNYNLNENYVIAENALEIAGNHSTTVASISIAYLVNQDIDVIPIMFFTGTPFFAAKTPPARASGKFFPVAIATSLDVNTDLKLS